jgi:hypothetical protein
MEVDAIKKKKGDEWKCFHCGKEGHLIRNCPEAKQNQAANEQDFWNWGL